MLRLIVLALLVLNLGYVARGQGWLLAYGWGPSQQREPQRVVQQVQPEAVQVLSRTDSPPAATPAASAPSPAASLAQAAPLPTACWQMSDLDAAQADTLRPLLSAKLSAGAWVFDETRLPGRWMVYLGKFAQPADLAKSRDRLTELNVKFFPVAISHLSPGLSLGVFSTEESANLGLKEVTQRGVRTAKVVQARPETLRYRLRLPATTAADQAALEAIRRALPDKTLDTCPVASQPVVKPAAIAAQAPASR